MTLAQEQIQKISFARNKVANANAPHLKANRKNHRSKDETPNDMDTTAIETDVKGIDYDLNGESVALKGNEVQKNKFGEITGVTASGVSKLEKKIKFAKSKETSQAEPANKAGKSKLNKDDKIKYTRKPQNAFVMTPEEVRREKALKNARKAKGPRWGLTG